MKIAYTRVSTSDQNLDRQIDAMTAFGCDVIYQEKKSGKNAERPELNAMLDALKEGDVVVVQKLDRLGRSLPDLLKIVDKIKEKKAQFISLTEGFDTTTAHGMFIFQVMGALAELERHFIIDRVMDGIKSAQAHGTKTGRPFGRPSKVTPENWTILAEMVSEERSVDEIASHFKMSKNSAWNYIKTYKQNLYAHQ